MKIILFQPDIAGNLGAVMRSSACFDIELEIIEPCGFPLTAKALRRTAMDYGAPETLIRHKSWDIYQQKLERVVIPIMTGARSLNLATSVAIAAYEALRQTDGLPS